jgi:tetratricopeptide (TPR) repeat protein
VHADLPKIARNLEANAAFSWPEPPDDRLTQGWRAVIDQCLHLDPWQRPATMGEVLTALESVEQRIDGQIEREDLLEQRRRAGLRAGRWCFTAGGAAALALLLGGLWQLTVVRLSNEKQARIDELAGLRASTAEAQAQKDVAVKTAAEAKRALEYERDISRARLEASRSVGDRLFSWALEKGHRKLPPLDGREQRLKNLERYFTDFLEHTAQTPNLEAERARVRLQLAEISLAAGDAKTSITRLSEAIEAWKPLPMDAALRFRLAQSRLLLALLLQSDNDPRMETAFAEARKALVEVPQTEVDADRLQQLISILDFHEAKILATRGDEAKALQQLMTATQTLNRLAAERPDSVVLRSELAACYLASATILEGMGSLGDAREVQGLAATEILKMLKQDPKDPGLRFDLAGCYGSMAEEGVLSGDIASADTMSAEAIKLLQGLVREQPDHVEAISLLASQIGLRAGLMRDRGESTAAVNSFDEAIRMLEAVRASAPDHSLASYRLALLWWQKGRMLGMAGKRADEIELIRRAHDLLVKLEAARSPGGPTAEKIQTSTAYLLGDLGHALQLSGKKPEAKSAFIESVSYWDRLLQTRPKSEEYQESIAWCRQRIKELD